MSERTVEPTSDEMVQLCRIVERIPEMQDIAVRAAVSLAQLRKDAERWRKLLAETLRNKGRIKVGMGGMWINGSYLEQQVDALT